MSRGDEKIIDLHFLVDAPALACIITIMKTTTMAERFNVTIEASTGATTSFIIVVSDCGRWWFENTTRRELIALLGGACEGTTRLNEALMDFWASRNLAALRA